MAAQDRYIAQKNMIAGQILPNRVTQPRLVDVLARIPRKLFVPEAYEGVACIDGQVPVGYNRYLMEPIVFAHMLAAADIKDTDTVLNVGCSGGYSSAILSHLAQKVVGLESNTDLATKANSRLNKLHIENSIIITGNLYDGHNDGGPYDIIFVNGTINYPPENLLAQLQNGGKLVCVFQEKPYTGVITIFTRTASGYSRSEGDYAYAAPLHELCKNMENAL